MKGTIRNGLRVSAPIAGALTLALALPACGSQGNDPVGSSSSDWSKAPSGDLHHRLPPALQITDCSLAEYVGILSAFNSAQIGASQLALSVSSNVDVRAFAQQMLTDQENLASQLSAWMTQANLTPVDSEISVDIKLASQGLLVQLRGDENFDRDFIVGQIGAQWMMSGFFETVAFMQDFSSSTVVDHPQNPDHPSGEKQFVSIVASAMQAVRVHLGLAFQVESKLVGTCGVAPAVVSPPDAGASSDCGCSSSDDSGSCSHSK